MYLDKRKDENLRGDKLRELILWVGLHDKFENDKIKMSFLKEKVKYHGPGGLYSAIDSSGYFDKKNDEITLSQKGVDYLKKQILPQYTVFYPIGNFFIILGLVLLLQWYLWTYVNTAMIFPWYSGIMVIAGGIAIRFFLMRLSYWMMKRKKAE